MKSSCEEWLPDKKDVVKWSRMTYLSSSIYLLMVFPWSNSLDIFRTCKRLMKWFLILVHLWKKRFLEQNIRKNLLVVIFADCNLMLVEIIVSFIHQHTRNNPGTNLLPTFLTSGIRFYTNGSRSITSFGFMSSTPEGLYWERIIYWNYWPLNVVR